MTEQTERSIKNEKNASIISISQEQEQRYKR